MQFEFFQFLIITIILCLLSVLITYLLFKITSVSKAKYQNVKDMLNSSQNNYNISLVLQNDLKKQITSLNEELVNHKNKYEVALNINNEELVNLKSSLATQIAINSNLQEKLDFQKEDINNERKKSLIEFENIANKILEDKSLKFTQSNKENINQILSPLKENLKEFKSKIEETYDKESKERFSLEARIKELVDLNNQISKEANNLTNALKGEAKTQGNWGEMILENILEQSGLVKNREYFTQDSYKDENGKRKQPDVIIKYPNDRQIIVDSKVSLTAYERFANCENKDEQQLYLSQHIKSIKSHIDQLSAKEYDKIEKSLDFVMLFVPIEPAYMTAIHFDQELWSYAYKKRILLISPTNLIAALKMVLDIWKREHQNTNALEIANRGEKLYNKFVGFVNNIDDIGIHLERLDKSYKESLGKLSSGTGNLISQAEKLKNLGINSKKQIPNKFIAQ